MRPLEGIRILDLTRVLSDRKGRVWISASTTSVGKASSSRSGERSSVAVTTRIIWFLVTLRVVTTSRADGVLLT